MTAVIRRAIDKWLAAGVWEAGRVSHPTTGTPQGGVVSPLMANVYLHEVLDVWFAEDVKPRLRGRGFSSLMSERIEEVQRLKGMKSTSRLSLEELDNLFLRGR